MTTDEDPTGLEGEDINSWLVAHPGTVIRYKVDHHCDKFYDENDVARAYYNPEEDVIGYFWEGEDPVYDWRYEAAPLFHTTDEECAAVCVGVSPDQRIEEKNDS